MSASEVGNNGPTKHCIESAKLQRTDCLDKATPPPRVLFGRAPAQAQCRVDTLLSCIERA